MNFSQATNTLVISTEVLTILGVPPWARWIAVDYDGEVNAFSARPVRDVRTTERRFVRRSISSSYEMLECYPMDNTLYGTLWRIR